MGIAVTPDVRYGIGSLNRAWKYKYSGGYMIYFVYGCAILCGLAIWALVIELVSDWLFREWKVGP